MPFSHAAVGLAAAVVVDLAGRSVRGGIVGEYIIVTVRTFRVRAGCLEPLVAAAAVVEDIVHIDGDALVVSGVDECLEVGLCAVERVHRAVVVNVVGVVAACRMCRRQPECRHSEGVQIVQLVLDALEIADAVAVAVSEAVDKQLVSSRRTFRAVELGGVGNYLPDFHALLDDVYSDCGVSRDKRDVYFAAALVSSAVDVGDNACSAVPAAGRRADVYPALSGSHGPFGVARDYKGLRCAALSLECQRIMGNGEEGKVFGGAGENEHDRTHHQDELFHGRKN